MMVGNMFRIHTVSGEKTAVSEDTDCQLDVTGTTSVNTDWKQTETNCPLSTIMLLFVLIYFMMIIAEVLFFIHWSNF